MSLENHAQIFHPLLTDARLRRQPPLGQGTGERQRDDQHRHVLLQDQERTPEAVKIRIAMRIRPWPFTSSSKCICSREDKFLRENFWCQANSWCQM